MALAFGASSVFAQTLTSKKGETILPEAGDWAIGFNATPFLNYVGNMLSSAGNTAATANWLNGDQTIVGKYYVNATTAYRASLRIGMGSTTQNAYVMQDGQTNPDPTVTTKDSWKKGYHNIVLGAGMEKRMGKTRLQGYYGAEAMIMLSGSDNTYTYGNAISSTDNTPTRQNFGSNNPSAGEWITKNKAGSTFGLGVRGIIGAEYFLFAKISIGAEYDWGVMFSSTGDGSQTAEYYGIAPNGQGAAAVQSITTKTGGGSSFGVDTGINSGLTGTGSLVLTLHF